MAQDFDLLGDPIPEGFGKRGRPPHRVTEEKRKLVIQLLAIGWTNEKIAAAIDCSEPTLRKNYFRELKAKTDARVRLEGRLLSLLLKEAEAGNVSAIDKYLKRLDRHDQRVLREMIDGINKQRPSEDPDRMGKKAKRQQAADATSGKYAVPSGPRSVN